MATTQIDKWAQELRSGIFNVADFNRMGKFKIDDVLAELTVLFPHKFLEHETQKSHEIGLALWHGRVARAGQKGVSHTYRHCLLLKSQAGVLTGLTLMWKLRFRPSPTEKKSFEFLSGAGMSVFRSPDGWVIKVLEEKTVSLPERLLLKRGWFFQEAT